MSVTSVRLALAHAIPVAAVLAYAAFGAYAAYVDYRLGLYCGYELPPKPHRWDPAYYAEGAAPWVVRARWIRRWSTAVWLGVLVGGNPLYFLVKP